MLLRREMSEKFCCYWAATCNTPTQLFLFFGSKKPQQELARWSFCTSELGLEWNHPLTLTGDKIHFKLKNAAITQQVWPLFSRLSEEVIFLFIYSFCFEYHSILEMQLSFLNVGQRKKEQKFHEQQNQEATKGFKDDQSFRRCWSISASPLFHFFRSVIIASRLDQPLGSSEQQHISPNEISHKFPHWRSDIRGLFLHGWTPKRHPFYSVGWQMWQQKLNMNHLYLNC